MRLKQIIMAGAVLALASGAAPAGAAILTTTYSGTVVTGSDLTGIFGAPGGNLAGAAFTIVYSIDTSVPAITYQSPTQTYTYGGTAYAAPSPASGVLTINGFDDAIGGAYSGWAYANNNDPVAPYGEMYHRAEDFVFSNTGYSQNYVYNDIFNPAAASGIPSDYRVPQTYALQPGDVASGQFGIFVVDYDLGTSVSTYGVLDFDSVTISTAPEPGAWALMVPSLGGVGLMLRRRRSLAPAA